MNNDQNIILTDEQVQLIEEERNKVRQDPDYAIDWEEARKALELD